MLAVLTAATRVDNDVYEQAVGEAARAVEKILKMQERSRAR